MGDEREEMGPTNQTDHKSEKQTCKKELIYFPAVATDRGVCFNQALKKQQDKTKTPLLLCQHINMIYFICVHEEL